MIIDQQPCLLASFEVFIVAAPPTSSPTSSRKCGVANWTRLSLCYSFINFFLWSGRIDFPGVQPPAATVSPQTFPVHPPHPQPHFFLLFNIYPPAELNRQSIIRLPGHLVLSGINAFYDHSGSCTHLRHHPVCLFVNSKTDVGQSCTLSNLSCWQLISAHLWSISCSGPWLCLFLCLFLLPTFSFVVLNFQCQVVIFWLKTPIKTHLN